MSGENILGRRFYFDEQSNWSTVYIPDIPFEDISGEGVFSGVCATQIYVINSTGHVATNNGETAQASVNGSMTISLTYEFDAPSSDIGVEKISLAQTVFEPDVDGDGFVDLVENKPMMIEVQPTLSLPDETLLNEFGDQVPQVTLEVGGANQVTLAPNLYGEDPITDTPPTMRRIYEETLANQMDANHPIRPVRFLYTPTNAGPTSFKARISFEHPSFTEASTTNNEVPIGAGILKWALVHHVNPIHARLVALEPCLDAQANNCTYGTPDNSVLDAIESQELFVNNILPFPENGFVLNREITPRFGTGGPMGVFERNPDGSI